MIRTLLCIPFKAMVYAHKYVTAHLYLCLYCLLYLRTRATSMIR